MTVKLEIKVDDGLDDPLSVIAGIIECSGGIESMLRQWVRLARTSGHSWQQIAHALGVSRQSAWERFREVEETPTEPTDPAFARAVERAYLRELKRTKLGPDADLGAAHRDLLASAIYAADRTNGGLRFKKLPDRADLESRLLRALSLHAST